MDTIWTRALVCPAAFSHPGESSDLQHGGRPVVAVFHRADGSRVEVAVRGVACAFVCAGAHLDGESILLSNPGTDNPRVAAIQIDDLRCLVGAPMVLDALRAFESGDLKEAARLVDAAGPQWARLIDLLGGPA